MLGRLIFERNGIGCTVTYSSGEVAHTENNLSHLGEFYRKGGAWKLLRSYREIWGESCRPLDGSNALWLARIGVCKLKAFLSSQMLQAWLSPRVAQYIHCTKSYKSYSQNSDQINRIHALRLLLHLLEKYCYTYGNIRYCYSYIPLSHIYSWYLLHIWLGEYCFKRVL